MRKSSAWMTLWDDRLLEVIHDEGASRPADLVDHKYIRVSKSTVSRRLRKLADHGLLQHLGNGVYSITPKGGQYLQGELDADELPDLSEGEDTANA